MRLLIVLVCGVCVCLASTPGRLGGATFTVTTVLDVGPGSLRDAISSANGLAGPDTIDFSISGAGPHTIFPGSQLPWLADPGGVLIDGLTEPGASAGANPPSTATLMIVVDGSNAGPSHGFWIVSSNNTIQGLVVNNFEQDGIRIEGTDQGTFNNIIYCNFIGTDQTGNVGQGNGRNQGMLWAGVDIIVTPQNPGLAFLNVVDANLISRNYAEGVSISNCPPGDVYQNLVIHNYIGTDINGTIGLGNQHCGVYIGEGAHDNIVDMNCISDNGFEGVSIVGYAEAQPPIFTYANIVANNIIGLTVNLAPLPNQSDGVSLGVYGGNQVPPWYSGGYVVDNVVVGDTIAYNVRNGVMVWEHFSSPSNADFNMITQNSIYDNGLLGIDLTDDGVSPNDPGDPDAGANEEVNFPVILSATYGGGQAAIVGTIDIDTDPTQAIVEVFRTMPDPSGNGEGELFVGLANPDAAGNWNVADPLILVPGDWVTATTTDMNFNTSEFCENVRVISTGVEEGLADQPSGWRLSQSRPNPFTRSTTIPYTVSADRRPRTAVRLCIYDISGSLVRTLVDTKQQPGHYSVSWDGRDESGRMVSSGVYFCTLSATQRGEEIEDFRSASRLVLIR